MFIAAGTGRAGTLTYVTASGGGNPPAFGQADVTLGNGTMDLVLTNQLTSTLFDQNGYTNYSAGQELNGVQITLGDTPTSVSLTSSDPATFRDFRTNPAQDTFSQSITRWNTSNTVSNSPTIILTALGGSQPSQLIIGAGVTTDQVNSSVVNFWPSILSSATFHLSLGGILPGTTIKSLTFLFGTKLDENTVPGVLKTSAAPEPSTLAGGLLAVLVGVAAHRRRTVRAAA
jgi:hypothetical protein